MRLRNRYAHHHELILIGNFAIHPDPGEYVCVLPTGAPDVQYSLVSTCTVEYPGKVGVWIHT